MNIMNLDYDHIIKHAFCNSTEVLKLTKKLCDDAIANNIEGNFCEAGCAYGAHGIVMNATQSDKKIYLFDSFEGIPVHGEEDREWTEVHGHAQPDQRKSGGITVCKYGDVIDTIARNISGTLARFVFVKGWFIDTFPQLTNEKFSVLRLDCDLYASYMLCFEYLYPRLSPGGWLIIDDWNLSGCKQAIVDSGFKLEDFQIENDIAYLKKK